jgi:hypothetical protein
MTMLDPAEQVLFRGYADTAAHNKPERRQHEPVAPWVQGTDESPCKTRDDECNNAAKQECGVQQKY